MFAYVWVFFLMWLYEFMLKIIDLSDLCLHTHYSDLRLITLLIKQSTLEYKLPEVNIFKSFYMLGAVKHMK